MKPAGLNLRCILLISLSVFAEAQAAVAQEKELLEATNLSEQNYGQELRDYRNALVANLDVFQALETLAETRRGHDRLLFDAQARRQNAHHLKNVPEPFP